jgi:hypothetical protein
MEWIVEGRGGSIAADARIQRHKNEKGAPGNG